MVLIVDTSAGSTSLCALGTLLVASLSSQSQKTEFNGDIRVSESDILSFSASSAEWFPGLESEKSAWAVQLHDPTARTPLQCRDLSYFSTPSTTPYISVSLADFAGGSQIEVGVDIGCGDMKEYRPIGVVTVDSNVFKEYAVSMSQLLDTELTAVSSIVMKPVGMVKKVGVKNVKVTCGSKSPALRSQLKPRAACTATPLTLHTFSTNSLTNSIGGNSGTGNTGSYSISGGGATWIPTISQQRAANWFTQLYPANSPANSRCMNLNTRIGEDATLSFRLRKTTNPVAQLTVGVTVGCGNSETFRTIGTVSLSQLGASPYTVYSFRILNGLSSLTELNSIKAVVLRASFGNVSPSTTFILDDVVIACPSSAVTTTIAPATTTTTVATTTRVSTTTAARTTTIIATTTQTPTTTAAVTTTLVTTTAAVTTTLVTTTNAVTTLAPTTTTATGQATATTSCPAAAVMIQDFSTAAQVETNLLGGWVNTDGTGTFTVASGKATWSPITSATTQAYWYSQLFDGATSTSGNFCRSLVPFGSSAAISLKLGKTTQSAASIIIGVDIGCTGTQSFRQIGTAALGAGVSEQTFTFKVLPGLANTADLASIKAVLLVANTEVPTGSVFTVDDLQIVCADDSSVTTAVSVTPAATTSTVVVPTFTATTITTLATASPTSCPAPVLISDFSTSGQATLNLLGGNTNSDGTGTLSISSGKLSWTPTLTSSSQAYWYSQLYNADTTTSGSYCLNLTPFGSAAAVSFKLGKTSSAATVITIGVDVGCGTTQTFRTLGNAALPAGTVEQTFTFPIASALVNAADLASIKAVLFVANSLNVASGTVFTVDDLQIVCSAPSPTSSAPVPTSTGFCAANGGEDVPAIPGVRPRVVSRCIDPDMFALTFDDGPNLYEQQVVDRLNANGIKATFFINSNNFADVTGEPQATWIKNAFNSGHQIASHTGTHPDMTTLTAAQIVTELTMVEDAMQSLIGKKPLMLRPPFGLFNDLVLQTVAQQGYSTVAIWNVDTMDWDHNSAAQSLQNIKTALEVNCPVNGTAAALELSHSHISSAADFVDLVAPYVKSRGYRFVTVAECVGTPAYR